MSVWTHGESVKLKKGMTFPSFPDLSWHVYFSKKHLFLGVQNLLNNSNPSVLNAHPVPSCNKDTGEKARLRQRTRGVFVAVSGGGNILYFNPIYKYVNFTACEHAFWVLLKICQHCRHSLLICYYGSPSSLLQAIPVNIYTHVLVNIPYSL